MTQNAKQHLLTMADSCVKCGLCLPHCPTYTHTQNENESPRGRIALIQAWSNAQLPLSANLLEHIDRCLLCRACEKACPAVVPYGKLIDDFRAEVREDKKPPLAARLLNTLVVNKKAIHWLTQTLNFYQNHQLQPLARALRLPSLLGMEKLERLIPPLPEKQIRLPYYQARTALRGDVGLFVGCMGEIVDEETVSCAIEVLTYAGFNVHVPTHQTCCGALARHEGDQHAAENLIKQNAAAFAQEKIQAIISLASGCASTLQESQDAPFSSKIVDISHFLVREDIDFTPLLHPLTANVTLHAPCSLKNALRTDKSVATLLRQIPNVTLKLLPDSTQCCGAAGSYSLRHPKMAQTLLDELLDKTAVLQSTTNYLVSSNIGCILHIAAGLREKNQQLTVIHPIVLLARQLKNG